MTETKFELLLHYEKELKAEIYYLRKRRGYNSGIIKDIYSQMLKAAKDDLKTIQKKLSEI